MEPPLENTDISGSPGSSDVEYELDEDECMFETWLDLLSEEEIDKLEEDVLEMIEEYVYGQIAKMSDPKFPKLVCDDITAYLFGIWHDAEICQNTDNDYKEVEKFITKTFEKYWKEYTIIPPRQCDIDEPGLVQISPENSLSRLDTILQPNQRTKEWYETRYQRITASNISKALGSDAQRNSLIYEKCKPLSTDCHYGNVNTENAMHWGVKYEPITAAIYEDMFSAKLSNYGCIPHEMYPFIGASPDGIVTDPAHARYGHMVEIKNIVNRDITGIPKEEYWIQMQVQLETCNLEYCDFVETRIKEYEDATQYYSDDQHKYKGVVLYFVKKMLVTEALLEQGLPQNDGLYNIPHYEYMPINTPICEVKEWVATMKDRLKSDYVLYKINYWYLDQISCVLVQRNREWFQSVLPRFIELWETIEKERISGYSHRAVVKKPKQIIVDKQPSETSVEILEGDGLVNTRSQFIRNIQSTSGGGICLIKLDEVGNSLYSEQTLL
jgi:putative phage-type endonuclease